jgi:rubrerythrin
MENISDEILNVIKYATKMEINGRSFYEHAAEITRNDLGKKVFQKLARDETEHIKIFGELFSSVLGGDTWKTYVEQEEYNKETVLEKLKTRVKKEEHQERTSDLEAIRIGMELERESINQYEKWAQETKDAKVQEIFKRIIEEEKFHHDLLQAEYDNITNSGFWFDSAEFRMDGKY